MRYRHEAKQQYIKAQASHMLARAARNRTRPWTEAQIGDRCFFFREVRRKGVVGAVPTWVGPGLVVGVQGKANYWVAVGGRCFLVAQEHLRQATGEEALFGRAEVQEAISLFKEGSKEKGGITYVDLTGQRKVNDGDLDGEVQDGEEMDWEGQGVGIPEERARLPVWTRKDEPLRRSRRLGANWMAC